MGRHKTPDAPVEPGQFDLSTATSLALGELQRRLGDEQLRQEIPGTGLIQLTKELLKIGEREAQPDPGDDEEWSLLDQVDHLPPDHAKGLLIEEIERLEGVLVEYRAKLGAL